MPSVQPPSGFRDFLNEDAQRRLELIHQISSVYQSFGFLPLETPVVENLELLLGGGGGEEAGGDGDGEEGGSGCR